MDLEFRATAEFLAMSKALKEGGQTELRKQLHAGVAEGAKQVMPRAQQALAAGLPSELQGRGARVKQVTQVRTGKDPGVTVGVRYGKRGRGLGASNARLANTRGVVRHPLFGDREHWFNTRVPGSMGWFDDTYADSQPVMRRAVEQAMEDTVRKIIEGARRG